MCAQVAPSSECRRGYKPRAVDCSHLVPVVAAYYLYGSGLETRTHSYFCFNCPIDSDPVMNIPHIAFDLDINFS